jgi:hypothetical protein
MAARSSRIPALLVAASIAAAPAAVRAQDTVIQPGQAAADREADAGEAGATGSEPGWHQHSWSAPPVYETTVTAGSYREEDPIGAYAQPRWTGTRRFPTTRVYVLPEGTLQFEWWWEGRFDLEGGAPVRQRSNYEVEIGLGARLQLDLYLETTQYDDGPLQLSAEKVELRWALADWGVIPTNPTLYLEFIRASDGPSKLEAKLLFGGEIVPGWHWGANLVYESQLWGEELENEWAITGGISATVIDEVFSLGLEVKGATADSAGRRFAFDSWEVLAGPSLQWRPVPPMHIDLVALFAVAVEGDGATSDTSPIAQPTLVAGWEF